MTAELLAIGSFGALAFSIAAAGPVLRLIFGATFVQAAPALPVLGGAFILISFGYLNGHLLLAIGQQRRLVRISLVALAVNLAGNFALVPTVGYMGAAWMTLATEAVVVVLAGRTVLRTLELPLPHPGRIGRTALAALVLGLALGAMRLGGAGLAVLVAAACVLYPALLLALHAVGGDDIRVLLRRQALA